MSHRPLLAPSVVLSLALFLAACGTSETADPGTPDGGNAPADAGNGSTAKPDAGVETPDAGTPTAPDAGGSTTPDAGSGTPDAGPVVGDNVLWNGGFEHWDDPLPDAWMGLQTNLPTDGVEKVTDDVREGLNACRLINESDTHKRFTTAPVSMRAGRYTCSYAVRGHGQIRIARYDTDFSSYSPSGYWTIDDDGWTEKTYAFSLPADVPDTFELVFSVRSTQPDRGHLVIDDVKCERAAEPCDTITCESWARCDNATATCRPLAGRCAADADCPAWEQCDGGNRCVLRANRCNVTADCAATPATPVCNGTSHACEAGDPCAGVTCTSPKTCQPASGTCGLSPGACLTTADCTGPLPACDRSTGRCVAATEAANIVPNGGFESWSTSQVPYRGTHLLPDAWYGLDIPGSSEIDPADVREWTAAPHGGAKACQLVGGDVALRFTTESFDIPSGNYTCAYWVHGRGDLRHRSYSSAGWSPWTDFRSFDTQGWEPVFFKVTGNVRDFRLIFYPSHTDPAAGHLVVDDVVCTRD